MSIFCCGLGINKYIQLNVINENSFNYKKGLIYQANKREVKALPRDPGMMDEAIYRISVKGKYELPKLAEIIYNNAATDNLILHKRQRLS